MDQSFSLKNFRAIYDVDLKKSGELEKKYFIAAHRERLKIKRLKFIRRKIRFKYKHNNISQDFFERIINKISKSLFIRKERYDNFVNSELQKICDRVNRKGYRLPLDKISKKISGKDVYTIGYDIGSIFVSRHLQNVLKIIYGINPSHRDIIVSRLKSICSDQSPKYIIKADIKDFYESISHKNLTETLHSSSRLSVIAKRILTQILVSYSKLTGLKKGLPRGIGLSAYLSELYMKDLDDYFRSEPDVAFYSRYVDDFVLVYYPDVIKDYSFYLSSVNNLVVKKELYLNSKTKKIDLTTPKKNDFEYLGYHFIFNQKDINIRLSAKRVSKYKSRIDQAFSQYISKSIYNPKKHSDLLINKIRFLTGNTRLLNAKSNAFTGVYFSNMYINDITDLKNIDRYLTTKISTISDHRLHRRLSKLSFEEGFKKIYFRKFTAAEFEEITKGWKDA